MNWRRLIAVLALIGVFLHADLYVRHNAMALGAALDSAARADAFGEICLGNTGADGSPELQSPATDRPAHEQTHCPVCLSMAGGAAILAAAPPFHIARYSTSLDLLPEVADPEPTRHALWPPGRAPPV